MPNWCMNHVVVNTRNADLVGMLAQFESGDEGQGLFSLLAPMPPELLDATYPNTPEDVAKRNVEEFGYPTWYEFAEDKWGTKWDVQRRDVMVGDITTDQEVKRITLSFDTAWSPPIPFLVSLASLPGTVVEAHYAEPSNGFGGVFNSVTGEDKTIEFDTDDFKAEQVDPLLARLDNLFCLYDEHWDEEEWDEGDGD